MSFEIESNRRDDYVLLRVTGPVTPENVTELASVIRRECEATETHGAIVDCSGMQGTLSAGSIFFTIQEFVRILGGRIDVAYIHLPLDWRPENEQLGRDVAHNHGGSLESFASLHEAVAWLDAQRGG